MSKIKAIRLTEKQDKVVEEFLQQNPLFDFSTLVRTALMSFIENPTLKLKSIKIPKSESTYEKR